jgi:hypothetical protein
MTRNIRYEKALITRAFSFSDEIERSSVNPTLGKYSGGGRSAASNSPRPVLKLTWNLDRFGNGAPSVLRELAIEVQIRIMATEIYRNIHFTAHCIKCSGVRKYAEHDYKLFIRR